MQAPSWMQKTLRRTIMVALAASRTVEGALSVPSGYESLMYDIRERVVVSERDVTRPTAEKVCSSTEGPFCLRNSQNFIGDTVLSRRLFGPDALGEALKTLNDYLATYSDELFRRYRQQQQATQDAQTKVRKAVVNPFTKLEEERKAAKAMKETMDRIKKHGREDTSIDHETEEEERDNSPKEAESERTTAAGGSSSEKPKTSSDSPKEEAATSKADATSGTGSSSGKAEGSPAAAEGKAGKSDGDVPTLKKGSASDDHSTSTAKSDKQNALLKALFGDNVEGGPPQGANFAAFHIDAGEVNLEELLGAQQGAAGANGEAGAAAVGGNLANLLGQALQGGGGGGGGGDPNNGLQVQAFRIDDPEQIMKLMAADGEDLEKMADALKKQAKKKDGLSEDEVAEEDENEMEEKEEASSSTSAKPIPAPDGRGKTPDRETGGTKAAEKNAANQDESAAAEANSSGSAEDSTKPKPGAATEDPEELLKRLLEGLGGAKDSPDKGAASSEDSPGSEEEVASPGSDDGGSTPTSDLDSDDEENENADTTKSKRFATSTKTQKRISAKERLRKRYRESYLRRVDGERNRWTFENAESYLQYFEEIFEATPSANRRRNIQLQQMETEVNFHKARPAKERAKSEKHPFFHAGAFTQFTTRYFPNAMDNFLAPLDMFSRQHVHREAGLYVRPTEEHAEDPGSPGTGVVRPEGYLDAWQEKHQPEDAQKGGSGMPQHQPVNVIFERAGLRQFSAEREDMKVVVRQRENVFATEVQTDFPPQPVGTRAQFCYDGGCLMEAVAGVAVDDVLAGDLLPEKENGEAFASGSLFRDESLLRTTSRKFFGAQKYHFRCHRSDLFKRFWAMRKAAAKSRKHERATGIDVRGLHDYMPPDGEISESSALREFSYMKRVDRMLNQDTKTAWWPRGYAHGLTYAERLRRFAGDHGWEAFGEREQTTYAAVDPRRMGSLVGFAAGAPSSATAGGAPVNPKPEEGAWLTFFYPEDANKTFAPLPRVEELFRVGSPKAAEANITPLPSTRADEFPTPLMFEPRAERLAPFLLGARGANYRTLGFPRVDAPAAGESSYGIPRELTEEEHSAAARATTSSESLVRQLGDDGDAGKPKILPLIERRFLQDITRARLLRQIDLEEMWAQLRSNYLAKAVSLGAADEIVKRVEGLEKSLDHTEQQYAAFSLGFSPPKLLRVTEKEFAASEVVPPRPAGGGGAGGVDDIADAELESMDDMDEDSPGSPRDELDELDELDALDDDDDEQDTTHLTGKKNKPKKPQQGTKNKASSPNISTSRSQGDPQKTTAGLDTSTSWAREQAYYESIARSPMLRKIVESSRCEASEELQRRAEEFNWGRTRNVKNAPEEFLVVDDQVFLHEKAKRVAALREQEIEDDIARGALHGMLNRRWQSLAEGKRVAEDVELSFPLTPLRNKRKRLKVDFLPEKAWTVTDEGFTPTAAQATLRLHQVAVVRQLAVYFPPMTATPTRARYGGKLEISATKQGVEVWRKTVLHPTDQVESACGIGQRVFYHLSSSSSSTTTRSGRGVGQGRVLRNFPALRFVQIEPTGQKRTVKKHRFTLGTDLPADEAVVSSVSFGDSSDRRDGGVGKYSLQQPAIIRKQEDVTNEKGIPCFHFAVTRRMSRKLERSSKLLTHVKADMREVEGGLHGYWGWGKTRKSASSTEDGTSLGAEAPDESLGPTSSEKRRRPREQSRAKRSRRTKAPLSRSKKPRIVKISDGATETVDALHFHWRPQAITTVIPDEEGPSAPALAPDDETSDAAAGEAAAARPPWGLDSFTLAYVQDPLMLWDAITYREAYYNEIMSRAELIISNESSSAPSAKGIRRIERAFSQTSNTASPSYTSEGAGAQATAEEGAAAATAERSAPVPDEGANVAAATASGTVPVKIAAHNPAPMDAWTIYGDWIRSSSAYCEHGSRAFSIYKLPCAAGSNGVLKYNAYAVDDILAGGALWLPSKSLRKSSGKGGFSGGCTNYVDAEAECDSRAEISGVPFFGRDSGYAVQDLALLTHLLPSPLESPDSDTGSAAADDADANSGSPTSSSPDEVLARENGDDDESGASLPTPSTTTENVHYTTGKLGPTRVSVATGTLPPRKDYTSTSTSPDTPQSTHQDYLRSEWSLVAKRIPKKIRLDPYFPAVQVLRQGETKVTDVSGAAVMFTSNEMLANDLEVVRLSEVDRARMRDFRRRSGEQVDGAWNDEADAFALGGGPQGGLVHEGGISDASLEEGARNSGGAGKDWVSALTNAISGIFGGSGKKSKEEDADAPSWEVAPSAMHTSHRLRQILEEIIQHPEYFESGEALRPPERRTNVSSTTNHSHTTDRNRNRLSAFLVQTAFLLGFLSESFNWGGQDGVALVHEHGNFERFFRVTLERRSVALAEVMAAMRDYQLHGFRNREQLSKKRQEVMAGLSAEQDRLWEKEATARSAPMASAAEALREQPSEAAEVVVDAAKCGAASSPRAGGCSGPPPTNTARGKNATAAELVLNANPAAETTSVVEDPRGGNASCTTCTGTELADRVETELAFRAELRMDGRDPLLQMEEGVDYVSPLRWLQVGQKLQGSYICAQGHTDVSIELLKVEADSKKYDESEHRLFNDKGSLKEVLPALMSQPPTEIPRELWVTALLTFKSRTGVAGSFQVEGEVSLDTGLVLLAAGKWVRQPQGYRTVGMVGTLTRKRLAGSIYTTFVDGTLTADFCDTIRLAEEKVPVELAEMVTPDEAEPAKGETVRLARAMLRELLRIRNAWSEYLMAVFAEKRSPDKKKKKHKVKTFVIKAGDILSGDGKSGVASQLGSNLMKMVSEMLR